MGSPPRVRGKEPLMKEQIDTLRITPACAGKSERGRTGRGKAQPEENRRITPACAGKRLKKAHKIKDFDPVPIRFHLVFRRFERWCSNLPTPDGNVPV